MSLRKPSITSKTGSLFLLVITIFILIGCGVQNDKPTPILIQPADTPVLNTATPTAVFESNLQPLADAQRGTVVPINELGNTPTYTPPPPLSGTGVRPEDVQQLRPAIIGPALPGH